MAKVGIPPEQREAVLACVAAVLHLGNVAFAEGRDADSSMVKPGGAAEEALAAAGARARRGGWGWGWSAGGG
jgi:myosin-5